MEAIFIQPEVRFNAEGNRICITCGISIEDRHKRARYCSRVCQRQGRTERRRLEMDAIHDERICPQCQTSFKSPYKRTIYCSRPCLIKANSKKNAAKRKEARHTEWESTREPCLYCGGPIADNKRPGTLYCTPQCKKNAFSARQRERTPGYMRWYLYGLTEERYQEMLLAQGNRCAICRRSGWGGRGAPHVDHDHSCCPGNKSCGKCVRGLLCAGCNPGIGNFNEDISALENAMAYLLHYRQYRGVENPPPFVPSTASATRDPTFYLWN